MEIIVALILLSLVLFFLEIFIPGGLVGGLAIILLIIAIVFSYFEYGVQGALITFALSGVISLTAFIIEISVLRKSKLGRKLFLDDKQKLSRSSPQDDDLIGKSGEVLTTMAPSGTVRIGDREFEGMSRSGLLTRGTPVRVVARDSFRIIVEAL